MTFENLNLHPLLATGLQHCGYEAPTPIQAQSIPEILSGRDLLGLAQTGTGKTAAFVLPMLHHLLNGQRGHIRALIVAPTRELASQIHEVISELGRGTKLRSTVIFGGVNMSPQVGALKRGVDIVVGCPGRLLDHLRNKTMNLSAVEVLVLDEADQMFDMGFLPSIRSLLRYLPKKRQTLFFSATMPKDIRVLAGEVLYEPVTVQVQHETPVETVSHALFPVASELKGKLLMRLLPTLAAESVLIFTRTKHRAKRLAEQLGNEGYRAASLQGNLSQNRRREAMNGFRSGAYQILVATDIAARGIDVTQISHVINFDMPGTPESYTHRIGRTGRMARSGSALTLIEPEDSSMVRTLERLLGEPIKRSFVEGFDYGVTPTSGDPHFRRPPQRQNRRFRDRRRHQN